MTIAKAEALDWPAIECTMRRQARRIGKRDWAAGSNIEKAVTAVKAACEDGAGYMVDGYLVLVDVVSPWHSDNLVLHEWLVLKVYPGGSISSVPKALIELSKEYGCYGIACGDTSVRATLAAAYAEAGFTPLGKTLFRKT